MVNVPAGPTDDARFVVVSVMSEHTAVSRYRATYQDVLDAPENLVAERIHGALHLHSRPASAHARAAMALGADLFSCQRFTRVFPVGLA